MAFQRLIRFVDESGATVYGDASREVNLDSIIGQEVKILGGDLNDGFQQTDRKANVQKLLAPLPSVPIFVCIGLNYKHHAAEAKLQIPKYPVVFTKPADAIAGPLDAISIHPFAQEQLDYEGELAIVIAKDCRDVPEADALSYILGYTCSNDVSARHLQNPANSGGQFSFAKSFDGFAPIGPAIVSPELIKDPQDLQLTTKVNGELRQTTSTSDMIWTIKQIIAFVSQGTTLRKGTVILTGTPSGIGLFMSPSGLLKDGNVVEIEIEKIGAIRNTMKF